MKYSAFRFTLSVSLICCSGQFARALTFDTVPIRNPGNLADTRYIDVYHPNGVGSVAQSFRIGKTEITNSQYAAFLNAVAASDPYGLYSDGMDSLCGIVRNGSPGSYSYAINPAAQSGTYTYEDKPIAFVGSDDAMRFANWLHNGQPTGPPSNSTTEDGAYTLDGAHAYDTLGAVTRNASARWWLPNEDEWYKAAYHKNDGATGNFWDYPTGTNSLPNNNPPSLDTGNSANFRDGNYTTGNVGYPMTTVGAYTHSASPYGTFDQGGNIAEWNETLFFEIYRGFRGGSAFTNAERLHASNGIFTGLYDEAINIGFRVATIIPEPGAMCLGAFAAVALLLCRRRIGRTQSF